MQKRHPLANRPGLAIGLVVGTIAGDILASVTRLGLWPILAGFLAVVAAGVMRRWTIAAWLIGLTTGYMVVEVPTFLFHSLP